MMHQSIAAFTIAALLLAITPGIDTALVLRTAAVGGARTALLAGLGICLGCFAWGMIVAAGLGVLLKASETAYNVLKLAGAAYLAYLGIKLLLRPRRDFAVGEASASAGGWAWLRTGFLTNILNPKVGMFYVSFVPQFIPAGADVALATVGLTAIHTGLSMVWFAALVVATAPLVRVLRRPRFIIGLDRVTGAVFLMFAGRLAFSRQ
jgi:threonine/homoserine/homoserine lactone efflux protein